MSFFFYLILSTAILNVKYREIRVNSEGEKDNCMKRKKEVCHTLNFAKTLIQGTGVEFLTDLVSHEDHFLNHMDLLTKIGLSRSEENAYKVARTCFTVSQWLKYKQCYTIAPVLAEDLFTMTDLSFPVDSLKLPFPALYLDLENLNMPPVRGIQTLGIFFVLEEVPYRNDTVASYCSVVILGSGNSGYQYSGITFDFYAEHMETTLEDEIEKLTPGFPESRALIEKAFLFAAYLSAAEPEVTVNPVHERIYQPSEKPKYSSIRKWDVGVRYMKERQKRNSDQTTELSSSSVNRKSPLPHIRRAHWHIYRTGPGRKEVHVKWIAHVTVGIKRVDELPTVIRKKSRKEKLNE